MCSEEKKSCDVPILDELTKGFVRLPTGRVVGADGEIDFLAPFDRVERCKRVIVVSIALVVAVPPETCHRRHDR